MSRKRVYFTEDQFQAIYELVNERVDYLVERSIDLQDSEILNDHEDLLDAHTVLEEAEFGFDYYDFNWEEMDYETVEIKEEEIPEQQLTLSGVLV